MDSRQLLPRDVLRSGKFRSVTVCDRLGANETVVVTEVDCQNDPSSGLQLQREVRLLRSLSWHPCVVRLVDDWRLESRLFVAVEYCAGGSLTDRLRALRKDGKQMPAHTITSLCADVAAALAHLHEHLVAHRALRPSCVFVSPRCAKLGCFGDSVTLAGGQASRGVASSPVEYLPPEALRGGGQSFASDIWGLGCVLWECITGRAAFEGLTNDDVRAAVLTGQPQRQAAAERAPELRQLAVRCLAPAESRPAAADLLGDPLFASRVAVTRAAASGAADTAPASAGTPRRRHRPHHEDPEVMCPRKGVADGRAVVAPQHGVERRLDLDFCAVGASRALRECHRSRSRGGAPDSPRADSPAAASAQSPPCAGICSPAVSGTPAASSSPPEDSPLSGSTCLSQDSPHRQRHLFSSHRDYGSAPPPTLRETTHAGPPGAAPPAAVRRRGQMYYATYKVERRRGRAAAISAAVAAVCLLATSGECTVTARPLARRSSLRLRIAAAVASTARPPLPVVEP